jgi:hypothetical protein
MADCLPQPGEQLVKRRLQVGVVATAKAEEVGGAIVVGRIGLRAISHDQPEENVVARCLNEDRLGCRALGNVVCRENEQQRAGRRGVHVDQRPAELNRSSHFLPSRACAETLVSGDLADGCHDPLKLTGRPGRVAGQW